MRPLLWITKCIAIFSVMVTKSYCQEVYYYAATARDLEVSAESESLLSFPAAPFARVCQPAGVIDLYPLESASEFNHLFASGVQQEATQGGQEADLMARHLKLVPKKLDGVASCAIRLVNEQVIQVRFVLSKMVSTPLIEFRSMVSKAKSGATFSQALGPMQLFRALVSGGELSFFGDETPSQVVSQKTASGIYRLVYAGTDKDQFRAWRFDGVADKDFSPTQGLRKPRLGEFYFSAYATSAENPRQFIKKGQPFQFFVLSRSDVAVKSLLEELP